MKSTLLISRMMRAIETEGNVGEGAELAKEYSATVQRVNSRLEAAQVSIDAKQISDAVRMMEDSPRLLDEVSTLDFSRLSDWEALCSRNGWTPPIRLDRTLLERLLMFNESSEAIEPFLRMYRKAVRKNDNSLAAKSLRRLVQIDHSQDWKTNLVQVEEAILKQLIADFRAAKDSGNEEKQDRVAQEFAESKWSAPPTMRGVEEIKSYIADKESRRRDVEGGENLSILRRCASENWSRPLASSMLQAIDGLVERGFAVPAEDRDMVDSCRRRCAEEIETEEKERRWKELCEQLHAAIQQEDTAAIRDVLSSPEFLDCEPDPELIRHARLVIEHEEAARRRKVLQIAVLALAGLVAVLGLSGWWLRQKLFNDRCDGEAVKLASLQNGAHAVDRLGEALRRLKEVDPDVYADPRVNVFEGKLKTMASQMFVRTNEIASLLSELTAMKESGWGDGEVAVTSRFERINAIISKDDESLRAEFFALKSAWADHCESVATANRGTATRFHETLISHIKVIAGRLKSELASDDLEKEAMACKDSIAEWRRVHAQNAPMLESAVDEAEMALAEAENTQSNLQTAIDKLAKAQSAKEYLEERKLLREFYSGYKFVADIGDHPIAPIDADSIVSGTSTEQQTFAAMLKMGVDDAAFQSFVAENVAGLADVPAYYSLYGIFMRTYVQGIMVGGSQYSGGRAEEYYFALCKGKPEFEMKSYDARGLYVKGELLDLKKGLMERQIAKKRRNDVNVREKMKMDLLPSSKEVQDVVDFVGMLRLDQIKFEHEIVKRIAAHLAAAAAKDFLKTEVEKEGDRNNYAVGRYPAARRLQMVQLYLSWLIDDLKILPREGDIARCMEELENLAQPVRADDVPDELTWAYMREARVRQRNSECARFLSRMATNRFMDSYQAQKNIRAGLRRAVGWRIEYAGCISFNPRDARWMENHALVLPRVNGNVKKDHPLYVLRREGGKLILKRALIPAKNGSSWAVQPGMSKELVTGDPLVQVAEQGKCIDAEAVLRDILKSAPADMAKQFEDKIPFFNPKVK